MPAIDFDTVLGILHPKVGKISASPKPINNGLSNPGYIKPQRRSFRLPSFSLPNIDPEKVFGTGAAILNGAAGLAQNADNAMRIQDDDFYRSEAAELNDIATGDYRDPYSLADAYARVGQYDSSVDEQEVRGMNDGQKFGSVLSAIGTGVAAGSFAGLPGMIFGGLTGLATGAGSVLIGDNRANIESGYRTSNNTLAVNNAYANLEEQGERNIEYNFRNAVGNARRDGGNIERRQSLEEFAARVLRKLKTRYPESSRVIRTHCKGGTMIRVKR